jgi:hypothetical protein
MTSHKDLALGDSSDRRDPVFRPRMELRERWSTQLPSVLVVVTLFSLAVLPLFVARKIDALRDKITSVAEPARQLVTETQGILALQTAAARGFALTGKSEFAEAHDSVRARRREAEHQLLSLVPLLGERTGEEVAAVMALRGTADALLDSLFEGRLSRQAYATRLNEQQARLESAIRGGLQIDQSLRRAIDLRVEGIERVERLGVILTVLLVLATLVAAFLVARLGRRYRRLALELDESEARYRDIAEREHAAREDAEAAQHEAEERRSDLERVFESTPRGFPFALRGRSRCPAALQGTRPTESLSPGSAWPLRPAGASTRWWRRNAPAASRL